MGRTSQWRKRHWKTEVVVAALEMLSGRAKKDYAREAQAVATAPEDGQAEATTSENGTPSPTADEPEEALVAM